MRFHIDANILLNFYRDNSHPLSLFDELDRRVSQLVITEQVRDEFLRNRASVLGTLSETFNKSFGGDLYTVPLVRGMTAHAEVIKVRDAYKQAAMQLAASIERLGTHPETDAVLTRFERLWNGGQVVRLMRSPEIINRAERRRLIGNPPSSPDRFSVGDEIIWESLLAWGADDLVLVSCDKTFLGNVSVLADEYKRLTNKRLVIVKRVSDAVKALGQIPSPALQDAELAMQTHRLLDPAWKIVRVDGVMAVVEKDGKIGRTPIGPEPDQGWLCSCGEYGPWNGVRCMSCGTPSMPLD